MKSNHHLLLGNRKKRIERRPASKNWEDQPNPVFRESDLRYKMAERVQRIFCRVIGANHLIVQRLGLLEGINRSLKSSPLPYYESARVLNIA